MQFMHAMGSFFFKREQARSNDNRLSSVEDSAPGTANQPRDSLVCARSGDELLTRSRAIDETLDK